MRGVQRLLCVASLALVLGACAAPKREPGMPAEELRALLERKVQAEMAFRDAQAAQGQIEEQKRLYQRALELDPSLGKAYNNLALIHLEEEDWGEAIRLLREAVKREPKSPVPRFNLGYAYELVGRVESAQEQYRAAVGLAPEDPDCLESLARVCIKREDPNEAKGLLRKALRFETRPQHVEWIRTYLGALEEGLAP